MVDIEIDSNSSNVSSNTNDIPTNDIPPNSIDVSVSNQSEEKQENNTENNHNESKQHLDKIVENILLSICDYLTLHSDITSIQDTVINVRMRELTKNNFADKIGISVMNFLDEVREYAENNQMEVQFTTSLDDYIDCFVYEKANQLMHYFYPAIIDGWMNYDYNTDSYTGLDREEFHENITEYFTITMIKHTFQEYGYYYTEDNSKDNSESESECNTSKTNKNNETDDDDNETTEGQLANAITHSSNTDCTIS